MISDNYIVETSYLYFLFEDTISLSKFKPNEGYIDGGSIVNVTGNFTMVIGQTFDIFLGLKKVP